MANSYSLDLRKKVMQFIQDGHSKVEACKVFNIGKSTLFSWFRKLKQHGTLEAQKPKTGQRKIDLEKLTVAVKNHPDKTLKEHAKDFNVSIFGIWKSLKKLGITLKKRQHIKKVTNQNVKSLKK